MEGTDESTLLLRKRQNRMQNSKGADMRFDCKYTSVKMLGKALGIGKTAILHERKRVGNNVKKNGFDCKVTQTHFIARHNVRSDGKRHRWPTGFDHSHRRDKQHTSQPATAAAGAAAADREKRRQLYTR